MRIPSPDLNLTTPEYPTPPISSLNLNSCPTFSIMVELFQDLHCISVLNRTAFKFPPQPSICQLSSSVEEYTSPPLARLSGSIQRRSRQTSGTSARAPASLPPLNSPMQPRPATVVALSRHLREICLPASSISASCDGIQECLGSIITAPNELGQQPIHLPALCLMDGNRIPPVLPPLSSIAIPPLLCSSVPPPNASALGNSTPPRLTQLAIPPPSPPEPNTHLAGPSSTCLADPSVRKDNTIQLASIYKSLEGHGFFYAEDIKLLLCLRCQPVRVLYGATWANHLRQHLKGQPDAACTRQKVAQLVSALPSFAQTLQDVPKPEGGQPAIPHLPLKYGWRCTHCNFCTTSDRNRDNHWGAAHPEVQRPVFAYEKVFMQSTGLSRDHNRLFWVIPPELSVSRARTESLMLKEAVEEFQSSRQVAFIAAAWDQMREETTLFASKYGRQTLRY